MQPSPFSHFSVIISQSQPRPVCHSVAPSVGCRTRNGRTSNVVVQDRPRSSDGQGHHHKPSGSAVYRSPQVCNDMILEKHSHILQEASLATRSVSFCIY